MAGFRIAWANECDPSAQKSYLANKSDDCILDGRDIKTIEPDEILTTIRIRKGELDVLDGSPPCQAFSILGKRDKGWGNERRYDGGVSQCNETMFSQYIRLLRGLYPKVFIAENVKGLVTGKAKGYFFEILNELKESGYNVACRLLDAQFLGVPQRRNRCIFIGVRNDLEIEPVFPLPLPYRYSVKDAIPWFSGVDIGSHKHFVRTWINSENVCGTIVGHPDKNGGFIRDQDGKVRKFTIAECKRICSFPDDFVLHGSYSQQWLRLGNAVPPVMMRHIAEAVMVGVLDKLDK